MGELLLALSQRRATRAFDPEEVDEESRELLWRAVSVAPSHGNAQAVRLLVPASIEQRESLVAALSDGNREWAGGAPLLVAMGALTAHEREVTNRDGSARETWGLHAGIALGNLMTQATAMGLVAHPMAGFDEEAVRSVFGAPADVRIVTVVAIGWPGEPDTLPEELRQREGGRQQRLPLDVLVVDGQWESRHATSARDLRKKRRE